MTHLNPIAISRLLAGRIVVLLLVLLSLSSCSTPKDVAYFQDAQALSGMLLQAEKQLTLRPEDKINIVVNSSNPMLESQFTLTVNNAQSTLGGSVTPRTVAGRSNTYGQPIAYTVDEQGTIEFPVLGKLSVAGKTRKEVASYIQDRLIARQLVSDPIVTVEYVNMGVNVLGEVNRAGHIDITKDHFTLPDALAAAGDLTIHGRREQVMVCRNEDGVNQVYYIDLTRMQQMLESPAYYLQQNDLIYVTPNRKRMRESRAAGNSFNTPAIWISIASLLTTITALIIK